jgi:hypothetical protein
LMLIWQLSADTVWKLAVWQMFGRKLPLHKDGANIPTSPKRDKNKQRC